ncbi:MAG TPA: uracil-DNA glycosylase [Steroidobacteraceae bacterium]|nr:uracil-DNA glycosylase [Steroidobacteraceae bacterium]
MTRLKAAARDTGPSAIYDRGCTACPRLAAFLAESRRRYPDHWSAPVPSFGDERPRILIVGLAPGLHGANRTGRPFTGDHAGILLYRTLFDLGLASQPTGASPDDGLRLFGVRITNAVKCVPPQNKPTGEEIRRCNGFLAAELRSLPQARVIVALGRVAHEAVLGALELPRARHAFAHAAEHRLTGPGGAGVRWLLDSYHCSRYNTQTRRLTPEMFQAVLARAAALADGG